MKAIKKEKIFKIKQNLYEYIKTIKDIEKIKFQLFIIMQNEHLDSNITKPTKSFYSDTKAEIIIKLENLIDNNESEYDMDNYFVDSYKLIMYKAEEEKKFTTIYKNKTLWTIIITAIITAIITLKLS